MSVQPIGSFSPAVSSLELRQRNQREHLLTLDILRHALEIRQALTHGTQSAQQQKPQGWTTQDVPASHELSHFGSTVLPGAATMQNNNDSQRPDTKSTSQETGRVALPGASASQGTTQPLATTDRNALIQSEATHASSSSEGYTARNLATQAPAAKSRKKPKSDDSGDVTVMIPAAKARSMGLLGPKEKDRDVFASLPKKVAQSLGLDSQATKEAA